MKTFRLEVDATNVDHVKTYLTELRLPFHSYSHNTRFYFIVSVDGENQLPSILIGWQPLIAM
jgi:hypothetical protein